VLATGHYRNGVLLTPVTGDAIAELLDTGRCPRGGRPWRTHRLDSGKSTVEDGA
jgi:glycine oxidase